MPRRARRTGAAYVDDERERDITFFKRRNGLFKGASDLSILTGASIAVVLEDQNRSKFHSLGTPLVRTVVDAALSRGMEPAEPFADEQLKGRLAPLERELAWLKDEAANKEETTQASKNRYKEAQKEEDDDTEDDLRMKKLFFSKPCKLSFDEMNELYSSLVQIQEQLRVRLPPLRRRGGKAPIHGSSVTPPPPPQQQLPQWPNLFGPHNQLLPVEPPPFIVDQPPPPPPPAAGGSLWIPEVPPPPPAGSPWAHLFPLRPPRLGETEPSFIASQQAPPQDNTQLAPLPPILEEAPLLQEPFLFSDQAPAPLQKPVEAHMPLEAQLFQEPFLMPDQAPMLAPLSAPLQMPVEPHFPLEAPLFQESFLLPDQAPVLPPLPVPLQMPVEAHMPLEAPLFPEPFLTLDQAPMLAPLPAPLEMPVEPHFTLEAPLSQEPFLLPDQAPVLPPLPVPLQMPVDAHMPLESPLFQEPIIVPDQAPMLSTLPAPLQMPVEPPHFPLEDPLLQDPFLVPDHLPHAPEAYNQELAVQQPQGYENYDYIFENVGLSQPPAAGASDDGNAALGNDDLFGYEQWAASPLYDEQIYFGTGVDDMGIIVGDHGGVPEADMVDGEHASSSGWVNDIADGAWF